ncbi:MAG: truB, partial [Candidatus Saccharibacteria bacterium]|nr:truB [Candidatus Saccharibacteria bacterium]
TDVKYKYPILRFTTEVSSGTYIRTLAEDIGEKLGTGAYLSALRRTGVGKFSIADASQLDEFKSDETVSDKLIE